MTTNVFPRPLPRLLAESFELYKSSQASVAVILACALVPTGLLAAAAFALTGITSQEALNASINQGEWLRASPLIAAGIVKRLAATLAYIALVFSLQARQAGRPLTPRECYGFAVEKFLPFVLTAARALIYICGGLLLLIVPGLILAVRYSLAHLAVLLEPCRGAAALKRSAALVGSETGFVVGRLLAATAVAVALNMAVAVVLAVSLGAARGASGAAVGFLEGQFQTLVSEMLGGFVGAWLVGYSMLLYQELADRHPLA